MTSLHNMHCYIVIPLVRVKKLVSVEDAPSAPFRGEDNYPHMLMGLSSMEKRFDGTKIEKKPVTENTLSSLSATNLLGMTYGAALTIVHLGSG